MGEQAMTANGTGDGTAEGMAGEEFAELLAAAREIAERAYTPPDQPGSLHVGGLQPIGAETAIAGALADFRR